MPAAQFSDRELIVAAHELAAQVGTGHVTVSCGFLIGLANVALHTPIEELQALRAELVPLLGPEIEAPPSLPGSRAPSLIDTPLSLSEVAS